MMSRLMAWGVVSRRVTRGWVSSLTPASAWLLNEVVIMDGDGGYGYGASVMMMVMLVVMVTKTSSATVSLVRLDSTSRFFWSSAVKSAWTLCTVC